MKLLSLALTLMLNLSSSQANVELLAMEHENYAWGFQYSNCFVDRLGNVNFITNSNEEGIKKIGELSKEEVGEIERLLYFEGNFPKFEVKPYGNDIGKTLYYGNSKGRRVLLKQAGDYTGESENSSAKKLVSKIGELCEGLVPTGEFDL